MDFDEVGDSIHYPLQCISKHPNRPKRVEIITLNHSPYFLKLPKLNDANHLIVQPEFPVFPCKCKAESWFTLGLFRLLGIVFVDDWDARWIYN